MPTVCCDAVGFKTIVESKQFLAIGIESRHCALSGRPRRRLLLHRRLGDWATYVGASFLYSDAELDSNLLNSNLSNDETGIDAHCVQHPYFVRASKDTSSPTLLGSVESKGMEERETDGKAERGTTRNGKDPLMSALRPKHRSAELHSANKIFSKFNLDRIVLPLRGVGHYDRPGLVGLGNQ